MTSFTPAGGFCRLLTSTTSFLGFCVAVCERGGLGYGYYHDEGSARLERLSQMACVHNCQAPPNLLRFLRLATAASRAGSAACT